MAELTVSSKNPSNLHVDMLVVGTHPTSDGVAVVGGDLPRGLVAQIEALAPRLNITGEANEVRILPTTTGTRADVIALTGLGARDAQGRFSPEALRRAAGAATRAITGATSVVLALPAEDAQGLSGIAEGALLGAYRFTKYTESTDAITSIQVVSPLGRGALAQRLADRAQALADSVNAVRDMVNTGPNDLYPETFAAQAKSAARGSGVKVTVLDEKALVSGGYGGLIAVGKGSERGPRLVKVTYAPSRAKAKIALVGKGITFDSGGISLKPAAGMEAMKSDMAGAAVVLHTVLAAARLGLPVAVTGWCALAENMPSGSAQRPSDVITMRGGKTVEVLNTDAEGRLVLADALVSAAEDKPDAIVDIATLTGAQVVALGTRVSAAMGTEEVREEIVRAAAESGEQFWPMPLPTELRASLDSKVADLANLGDRFGGMLTAGLFLREFTAELPWAHLDIAGPAFNEGTAHDYTPVGGTGVGVRTLLAFLEGRAGR